MRIQKEQDLQSTPSIESIIARLIIITEKGKGLLELTRSDCGLSYVIVRGVCIEGRLSNAHAQVRRPAPERTHKFVC